MSNTPANNQPDTESVVVDILWDPSVISWQRQLKLTDERIIEAVLAAAAYRGYHGGQIGVRITDDQTIHQINARHLSHDYPTDVISFPYSDDPDRIEGELVASVETARQNATDVRWETSSELLLYIIHGVLHIGGMDDHNQADRAQMRTGERVVLCGLGIDNHPAAEGDGCD